MARTDLKLREVLLKNSIGIFDDIRIFCGHWPTVLGAEGVSEVAILVEGCPRVSVS